MFDPISEHHAPESEQTQEIWSEYQLPAFPSEHAESDAEPIVIGDHEQSSRSFLIFLGSTITILLLCVFLYLQISSFLKLLLLLALFAAVLLSVILYDQRHPTPAAPHHEPATPPAPLPLDPSDYRNIDADPELRLQASQQFFEHLVQEALDSIPTTFQEQMHNLVIVVEDEPEQTTLQMVGTAEGQTLLGLYHGVPLTTWGYHQTLLPEQITIYQHTIERYCGYDPVRIRAQVRATLLHELAHHFGMGHAEMPIWVK